MLSLSGAPAANRRSLSHEFHFPHSQPTPGNGTRFAREIIDTRRCTPEPTNGGSETRLVWMPEITDLRGERVSG